MSNFILLSYLQELSCILRTVKIAYGYDINGACKRPLDYLAEFDDRYFY